MVEIECNTKEDAAFAIARYAAGLKYEDIPPQIVAVVKKSILDTLGVTVGASGVTPGIKELVALVKREGGRKESSILVFGGRVPAYMAAFCNGAMAHCLDYDDMNDRCWVHPSAGIVPAAIAVAESLGGVSGRGFITAVALGQDVACRLGLSIKNRYGWHTSPVFGVFGAALSCGKLLNFNEEQHVGALGVALSQAATTMQVRHSVGSDFGGMYAGFAAKGGVLASFMVNIGITGPGESLEGDAGLFQCYFRGEYDRNLLLRNLGKEFENNDISFKLWPSCRPTHPYINGALSLLEEHQIQPQDIENVEVYVGGMSEPCSFPLEKRRRPISTLDAKYSLPFCVATALVKKWVTIKDMTPEGINNPEVLAMAQRIVASHDPEIEEMFNKGLYAGKIDIHTKQGQTFSKRVEYARGHPRNPPTKEELIAKFMECATVFSAKPISEDNARRVVEMVDRLETENITEIVRYLS